MNYLSNMTSKGQVTVPKDIRDALGLLPGHRVEFALDAHGDAVIRKASDDRQRRDRETAITHGVKEARRLFNAEKGLTNGQWYEMMRGPPAEV